MTDKRRLVIELNHLPPSVLNLNARVHWAVRHQATSDAKEEVGWLAKIQWKDEKPMMKARITYKFFSKDQRRRDIDNLQTAMKFCPDSLIEVGALFYDDAEHLTFGISSLTTDTEDRTIISVEEIE